MNYSFLNIDCELLPEKFNHISNWKTEDVVKPNKQKLMINKAGEIYYYCFCECPVRIFYSGNMRFYIDNISGNAFFINGILEYIEIINNEINN